MQVIFLLDLNRVIEIGLLFDFYGKLLTDRQQKAMLLYYYDNLSLSEIAERLNISRQGVYDHLHRGENLLKDYENKLGLIAKYKILKDKIEELLQYLSNQEIDDDIKKDLNLRLNRIKKNL